MIYFLAINKDEEFRARHEAMIDHQRREAQRIRRCIEEEKSRLKSLHSNHTGPDHMSTAEEKVRIRHVTKDSMYSYFSKVGGYLVEVILFEK